MFKLTPRQASFVDKYIELNNGAEAARQSGYSTRSARTIAAQLMANLNVKEAIEAKSREIAEQRGITRDNALEILWNDARNAPKAVDRKGAVDSIAKIMGWTKENTSLNVGYFTQVVDKTENTT